MAADFHVMPGTIQSGRRGHDADDDLPLADVVALLDRHGVWPSPGRAAHRVEHPAVARGRDPAGLDLAAGLLLAGLPQLQDVLRGELGRGPLDLADEPLDRVRPGELLQMIQLRLGQLEGELGALERQLGGDFLGLGNGPLVDSSSATSST